MTLLGRLLHNRRAGEAHTAWNLPNLQGPALLTLTSRHFAHGDAMPPRHGAKNIGGENLSPHLAWTAPPPGTAQLLLVVEDIDVPLPRPAVRCAALVDPASRDLGPGALDARRPSTGVRVLRSTLGRGYHAPRPSKATDRTATPSNCSPSGPLSTAPSARRRPTGHGPGRSWAPSPRPSSPGAG